MIKINLLIIRYGKTENHLQLDERNYFKIAKSLNYHHFQPEPFYDQPIVQELTALIPMLTVGGQKAIPAINRLNTIVNQPGMNTFLKTFKPLIMACKSLVIRESESPQVRMGCQQIMVRMSDQPSTVQYADPQTGVDYGKESLVVVPRPSRLFKPDREVAKLRAGADLNHIQDGLPVF